jgi:hypothetical protein
VAVVRGIVFARAYVQAPETYRLAGKEIDMRTMHLGLFTILSLALILALATPAQAADANGTLKAVLDDKASFIMTDQAGNDATYRLSNDARIEINGEVKALSDLREGDEITVTWVDREGLRTATVVVCRRM